MHNPYSLYLGTTYARLTRCALRALLLCVRVRGLQVAAIVFRNQSPFFEIRRPSIPGMPREKSALAPGADLGRLSSEPLLDTGETEISVQKFDVQTILARTILRRVGPCTLCSPVGYVPLGAAKKKMKKVQ
jgi:hypothetical protein